MEYWLCILFSILVLWGYLRYFGPVFVSYIILHPDAMRPSKAYHKAACYDIYSVEEVTVPDGEWREIRTGLAFAPWPHIYLKWLNLTITPFGNVAAKVYTRSGHARKKGLRAHLGIIDNDFRDEWTVIMYNHGTYPVRLRKGERIAQFEFYRVQSSQLHLTNKLSSSERGKRGFGSTGK